MTHDEMSKFCEQMGNELLAKLNEKEKLHFALFFFPFPFPEVNIFAPIYGCTTANVDKNKLIAFRHVINQWFDHIIDGETKQ